MFDWIDPRADGACGNIRDYVLGNVSARGSEVHWASPTVPPSGKEMHCIRPGNYRLYLYHGTQLVRQMNVDYVPEHGFPVYDPVANVIEYVEKIDYGDTTYQWDDVWVNFNLQSQAGWDAASIRIDNGGASPYDSLVFVGQPEPWGGKYDYFRISSRTSTTSGSGVGRLLSRLYWDAGGNLGNRSGFYDAHSQGSTAQLRIHQFIEAQQSASYLVGLETMRPEESPVETPAVTLAVSIEVSQPPVPLGDSVSGPDILTPSSPTSFYWEQFAYGGAPPYTYGTWRYYRYPGPETTVGTGKFLTLVVGPTTSNYVFRLRASASDATQSSATGKFFVEVIAGGRGLLAEGATVGVRFPDGTCRARPVHAPARQQWLQWVFERRGGVVGTCRIQT